MSETKQAPQAAMSLDPIGLASRIAASEVVVIDVRQNYEWATSRIAEARHIPLESLPAAASSISDKQPIVFVCRSGNRSQLAAAAFNASGREAINLEGGMLAWEEAGLPVEPTGAAAAPPSHDAS